MLPPKSLWEFTTAMRVELVLWRGQTQFWALAARIVPFWIEILETNLSSSASYQVISRRSVGLSGHWTSNNLHLAVMTISWWCGVPSDNQNLCGALPHTRPLLKLLLGHRTQRVCWCQVAAQLTAVLGSGIRCKVSSFNQFKLSHKSVISCSVEIPKSWSARMATARTPSVFGSTRQCEKFRLWQDTTSECCIWRCHQMASPSLRGQATKH